MEPVRLAAQPSEDRLLRGFVNETEAQSGDRAQQRLAVDRDDGQCELTGELVGAVGAGGGVPVVE
ncbi:hypothetical protein LK08_24505 [Streptomyces sp. MUSC 125]|uniref:hypothetical protein n=1 Tax=Streptomyces TaxID=1883 RepID=UPI000573DB8F|nr:MULTISPECIES: hypothetical protein [Streptomyces]KIE24412.1 hypothetical protein LK08_24505 [Streptomyces sp. MUSC 125]MCH0560482.1 hypothetical protein [Streptomyces sp. MUM 16J]